MHGAHNALAKLLYPTNAHEDVMSDRGYAPRSALQHEGMLLVLHCCMQNEEHILGLTLHLHVNSLDRKSN